MKRKVTQSTKPDDHIGETLDLALICLWADHFPLNSTLDSIVGVAGPRLAAGVKALIGIKR